MSNPLATARQLWRLNKEGRLALVESGTPIPVVVADAAIKACTPTVVTDTSIGWVETLDGTRVEVVRAMDWDLDGAVDGTTEAPEA